MEAYTLNTVMFVIVQALKLCWCQDCFYSFFSPILPTLIQWPFRTCAFRTNVPNTCSPIFDHNVSRKEWWCLCFGSEGQKKKQSTYNWQNNWIFINIECLAHPQCTKTHMHIHDLIVSNIPVMFEVSLTNIFYAMQWTDRQIFLVFIEGWEN